MCFATTWLVTDSTAKYKIGTDTNHDHRSYEDLPEDLWIEIFIRSSVQSLQNVQWVCTLWYALVNKESFKKMHLQFQKKRYKNNQHFLLRYERLDTTNQSSQYLMFDEESIANGTNLSSPFSNLLHHSLHDLHGRELSILGPVNGLYCVHSAGDGFVIWNPATEEFGVLPSPAELLPTTDYTDSIYSPDDPLVIGLVSVGFGVDPSNEENYKLLLICHYDRRKDDDEGFCRLLYTTSTNTWRLVEDAKDFVGSGEPRMYCSNNTYLKGFYYWLVASERVALVFDMGKEEAFHTISAPDINVKNARVRNNIVLHNGHISLIIVNETPCDIDIWVLIEEESIWTKKASVRGILGATKPVGICNNKDYELLLVVSDPEEKDELSRYQTVLYNTSTQKVKNIGPHGYVLSKISVGESLVSLSSTKMLTHKGRHGSSVDAISHFLYGRRI